MTLPVVHISTAIMSAASVPAFTASSPRVSPKGVATPELSGPGTPHITIAIERPCRPAALEAEWRGLEARGNPPFFLTWAWIGTLLEQARSRPWLIRAATPDGRSLGLALLGLGQRRGRLGQTLRVLHLNESADPALDAVYIEANGFLLAADAPAELPSRMLACILATPTLPGADGPWDELVMSGMPATLPTVPFHALAERRRLSVHVSNRKGSAVIDLRQARAQGGVLPLASAGMRQKIRRSMRLYEERGPLRCESAEGVAQAQDWLAALAELHQASWRARGLPGAFANPSFTAFHRALLPRAIPEGRAEILRISAGDQPIGYLYDFVAGAWAGNYQGGFSFEPDNRLRPGLVSLVLAADRRARLGSDTYDFLAGDNRYKQQLGQPGADYIWFELRRPRLLYAMEDQLRAARRWARRRGLIPPA